MVTQEFYMKRLKAEIEEITKRREVALVEDNRPHYIGSLGGQLTILKRELAYLANHKIV